MKSRRRAGAPADYFDVMVVMGVDLMRIMPGSRDMAPGIGAESMQGLAKARTALQTGSAAFGG